MRVILDNVPGPLSERQRRSIERALLEEQLDPLTERVEMVSQFLYGGADERVKARAATVALGLYGPSRN